MSVVHGTADDFKALAVRSACHKATVLTLKTSVHQTLEELGAARNNCLAMVRFCSFNGKFSRRKQNADSAGQLLECTKTMQQAYQRLVEQVNAIEALNKEHRLCLSVPKLPLSGEEGERMLMRFVLPFAERQNV